MISGAKVQNGRVQIRVWQRNINKLIVLTVPCDDKLQPIANGDFELFGVPNKYAEVITDFRDPGDGAQSLIFPTNNPVD
jgi:2-methylaconitate cis-trans-isomerase PrpF